VLVGRILGGPTFVNECQRQPETVGDGGRALSTASIGADDDCVSPVGDVMDDVALQNGSRPQVVDYGASVGGHL
jgi:hypothetical protein